MRAVLDPNVIISAFLSPSGPPAEILRAWQRGDIELVVSAQLIAELERDLAYPKLQRLLPDDAVAPALQLLADSAEWVDDPDAAPAVRSPDPGDDYLVALAAQERAALVSGDKHLLSLRGKIPVYAPREFIDLLGAS